MSWSLALLNYRISIQISKKVNYRISMNSKHFEIHEKTDTAFAIMVKIKRGFGLPNMHLERRWESLLSYLGYFFWKRKDSLERGAKNPESQGSIQGEQWTGDILPVSRTRP